METNFSGSYTALAAIIVAVIAHFGVSIQITDVVAVIAGNVAFIGIVKQMIDHQKVVTGANQILANTRRPQ